MAKSTGPDRVENIPCKSDLISIVNGCHQYVSSDQVDAAEEKMEEIQANLLKNSKTYQAAKKKYEELNKKYRAKRNGHNAEQARLIGMIRLHGPSPKVIAMVKKFAELED